MEADGAGAHRAGFQLRVSERARVREPAAAPADSSAAPPSIAFRHLLSMPASTPPSRCDVEWAPLPPPRAVRWLSALRADGGRCLRVSPRSL
jgi:hypothetical protein